MDADVESFFEECRAHGLCRDTPENFDHLMGILEKFYLEADELASFQEFWDDTRGIAARKEPRMERLSAIVARLKSVI
jgi:hypothetical protein